MRSNLGKLPRSGLHGSDARTAPVQVAILRVAGHLGCTSSVVSTAPAEVLSAKYSI